MVAYYLILFLKEMITNHLEDSVEDIEIIMKSNMIFLLSILPENHFLKLQPYVLSCKELIFCDYNCMAVI